jgi:hypothetical protein
MANPLAGFWARLTPRERTYIMVLVLVFFVMGTLLLLYMRSQTLRDIRNDITAHRRALEQVYTRGAVYEERLAAKKKKEANISTEKLLFLSLVEESQTGIEELTVTDQEEQPAIDLGGGVIKRTFDFRLRSVKLEDMVKFLTALESKPGRIILTERLELRSPSSSEDRVNATVTIATWERLADPSEAESEAEAGDDEEAGS